MSAASTCPVTQFLVRRQRWFGLCSLILIFFYFVNHLWKAKDSPTETPNQCAGTPLWSYERLFSVFTWSAVCAIEEYLAVGLLDHCRLWLIVAVTRVQAECHISASLIDSPSAIVFVYHSAVTSNQQIGPKTIVLLLSCSSARCIYSFNLSQRVQNQIQH